MNYWFGTEAIARNYIKEVKAALESIPMNKVEDIVNRLYVACQEGNRVFIIGNGGSASTASHMACDLTKTVYNGFHFNSHSNSRLKVIALTDNVPLMTAWANDSGYEKVFGEQLRSLAEPGDILIAISGSGNSANVVEAVKLAKTIGLETIGILGFTGGALKELVDKALIVASNEYGPIEDVHLVLNHMVTCCLKAMMTRESSVLSVPL